LILSKAPIFAEAGEIFAGSAKPAPGRVTVFKSVGLAVEDIAAALLAYRAATGAAPRKTSATESDGSPRSN
jgi:ornithine cyclodeaminase/alanine dehydrogenase-like protein (mu-crystallin family)